MMSDGGGQGGGSESSKPYDYLLKFLLVGDSDVGKHEILQPLEDGSTESPFCVGSGNLSLLGSVVWQKDRGKSYQ